MSLSDNSSERFEELLAKSGVSGAWVEQWLGGSRINVQENEFAKHWYCIVAVSEDRDTSWGAWHVFLDCADERFKAWRKDPDFQVTDKRRKSFARINMRDLPDLLPHKKERSMLLFLAKIERGRIFPFANLA